MRGISTYSWVMNGCRLPWTDVVFFLSLITFFSLRLIHYDDCGMRFLLLFSFFLVLNFCRCLLHRLVCLPVDLLLFPWLWLWFALLHYVKEIFNSVRMVRSFYHQSISNFMTKLCQLKALNSLSCGRCVIWISTSYSRFAC